MATLTSAVIELVIGGQVIIYGEGSTPVITQEITEETGTTPANKAVHDAFQAVDATIQGVVQDMGTGLELVDTKIDGHTKNSYLHFSELHSDTHLDKIVATGVYRVSFYDWQGSGLYSYAGVLMVSIDGFRQTLTQTLVFKNGVYNRKSLGMAEFLEWDEWTLATPLATADSAGLMSINQFKSVEDMITNFQGLIESQTDIKEAIADLSKQMGYSDDFWDSSLTLVSKSITGTPVRVAQAVGYTLGTGRVSKVIDKEGTFLIKGDDSRHFAPLTLDDQENVVQMYNKGATSVTLEFSGGTERFQRLSICSNTITRIHGNYAYVNELDVTRCTNLETIQSGGNAYSTLDLQYNLLLKLLSLSESLKLTTLDLRKNAAVTNLNLSRSILVASVNISGCIGLTTIDFNRCLALKYSGITFPATFRPKTMNISETAFTYADIISMVTNKWTYGEASSTIQVAQDMYDIIVAGDMAPFTIKNVNVVVI